VAKLDIIGKKFWRLTVLEYFKLNPISDDTKNKISLKLKNIKRSEETKLKISKANKGIVISEEQKKRLSEVNKGPKIHCRNIYNLISPDGYTYKIIGKDNLLKFIHNNELSVRKILDFINNGVIKEKDVRNINNKHKIKTFNCVGWKIKKIKK